MDIRISLLKTKFAEKRPNRAVTGSVLADGGSGTDRSRSFSRKFGGPMARKKFGNDRSRRRARFRQIFIQIRAILAIFRPFEVFAECPIVALVPMWLEFGGGTPSFLAHPLSLPDFFVEITFRIREK